MGIQTFNGAASRGKLAVLREFIEAGVDRRGHGVNDRMPSTGFFPLGGAVWRDNIPAARMLLDAGAYVNRRTKCGWTPLYIAVWRRNIRMVRELIRRGANPNTHTKPDYNSPDGYTPLHLAARNGDVTIAGVLVGAGARTHTKDGMGDTPARTAARVGHFSLACDLGGLK